MGSQHTEQIKILITASGTGGHLFPARHIIKELLVRKVQVEFVGSGKALEAEILESLNVKRYVIAAVGIKNRGLKGLFQFVFCFPKAFWQVWRLFSEIKPQVVIGVGGYATFLPVLVAFLRGVPTWIHESEQRAGLANYFLAFIASRISTAFEKTQMPCLSKIIFTGQPVRSELNALTQEGVRDKEPTNLLIIGGSQGAKAIDTALVKLIPFLEERGLSVWHQCRKENYEEVLAYYQRSKLDFKVTPFIQDMVEAYRWSDIIISRSGASATMEIGVINRPAIFVPFPHAQANHQVHNALVLVEQGKAMLVEEGDGFEERLRAALLKLLDQVNYLHMQTANYATRPANAAGTIADGCIALVEKMR